MENQYKYISNFRLRSKESLSQLRTSVRTNSTLSGSLDQDEPHI